MTDVISQQSIGPLVLASGFELPDVTVAYSTFGNLSASGDNAVLITHGYTSSHLMLTNVHHTAEGSWASLVGPGRTLDTDKYFVVCSNMLGSSFGTTGPNSINPSTGEPWGLDFPDITLGDIVEVQHRLLRKLGVRHLRMVAGPSYGGWQSLQWGISHPDLVDAIGSFVSGLKAPDDSNPEARLAELSASPEWNGGKYHSSGGMKQTLFEVRYKTLVNYGLERVYEDRIPDPAERMALLEKQARQWAEGYDPMSFVVLGRAAQKFDIRTQLAKIRAKVVFMVCTTDKIFPPNPDTVERLKSLAGPYRYVELDSPYGHMASGIESRKLESSLTWLLEETAGAKEANRSPA